MNKSLKGLIGLGIAGAAGCAAVEAEDSLFLEETVRQHTDGDMHQQVAVLSSGGQAYFNARFRHFEDHDLLEYGGRGRFGIGSFLGTAEIIGFEDSDNNSGAGVNGRGKIGENTTIGFAFEKRVDAGTPTQMSNIYASHIFAEDWGNFELTAGAAGLDGESNWIAAFGFERGKDLCGFGVFSDGEGGGYATAYAGRFTETQGEGFGYRLRGQVSFDSNDHMAEFICATRTKLSYGSAHCPIAPDNGMLDPGLMDNRFDTHSYIWEKGNGVVAHLSHSDIEGVETLSADLMNHWKCRGVFPRLGMGYSRIDDGTGAVESGRVNLGAVFKKGYVDITVEQTSEGDTNVLAIAGAGVTF